MDTLTRLGRWRIRFAGITRNSTEELLYTAIDGVLDCFDSRTAKAHLLLRCKLRKRVVVTTGGKLRDKLRETGTGKRSV